MHLLPYHALDVAAVGRVYLKCNPGLLNWLVRELGASNSDDVLSWLTFWLAIHDLGKFSLSFQQQRSDLLERLQGMAASSPGLSGVRHDSLGNSFWGEYIEALALQEAWFGDNCDPDGLIHWVRAVCGHHGQPPELEVAHLDRHFRPQDREAAQSYAQDARKLLLSQGAAAIPEHCGARFEPISSDLSWWVAGLTVLADWLGSNAGIFSYRDQPAPDLASYWPQALVLAEQALAASGVLPVSAQASMPFASLFPHISQPSPLQSWAARTPLQAGPQIHLLEDVTGAGKTEAALTLAHRLMSETGAEGFFIGLPTMATANAMYERISSFYVRLFDGEASLALAHGRSYLVENFATTIVAPGQQEQDAQQQDESATARCTHWLADHNKRALLAPAGIGTIDQALLGALQSKHQSLRLLGLARKVLIVDEVHACDAYMQRTLQTLLEFHARAGGSAILLSATLSNAMKAALLRAFAKGSRQAPPKPSCLEYPLASSWSATTPTALTETPIATRSDVQRTVNVRYVVDRNSLVQDIAARLKTGQCVAWIRNSVADVIEAREQLAALWPAEKITLFHARFTLGDRLRTEQEVLRRFGRDSGPEERAGQLLISTQVAEQSLDIDMDLLISDLAPIDRLIQRFGRLRRHIRNEYGERISTQGATDQRGEPWAWVLGPVWQDEPTTQWLRAALPRTAAVYGNPGHVWLSARALQAGQLRMPNDARDLIETVFDEGAAIPQGLQHKTNEALGKTMADASHAQLNSIKLSDGYVRKGLAWSADSVAPSRLGEATQEILLGRWEGDTLLPWCHDDWPAKHAWAYSSLKLAKRLISEAAAPSTPARAATLRTVLESLPGGGKWVLLLALENIDGRYCAQAFSIDKDGKQQLATWIYDSKMGLLKEQAPEGNAPGA